MYVETVVSELISNTTAHTKSLLLYPVGVRMDNGFSNGSLIIRFYNPLFCGFSFPFSLET